MNRFSVLPRFEKRLLRRVVHAAAIGAVALVTTGLLWRVASPPAPPPAPFATPAVPVAPARTPILPAWILLFERDQNGIPAIWAANGDGSNPHLILSNAEQPTWAPDRSRFAFARNGNVYTASPDGSGVRQLTFWTPTRQTRDEWQPRVLGIGWNARDKVLSVARDEVFHLRLPSARSETKLYGAPLFQVALDPDIKPGRGRFAFPVPSDQAAANWHEAATASGDESVAPRFDVTDDRTRFSFADNTYPVWSPSGDKLLFARNGDVWLAARQTVNGQQAGWDVQRVVACAEYDGNTVGGSRWTVGATAFAWAPDESYFVYGLNRLSGSGVEEIHLVRPRTVKDKDGYIEAVYDTSYLTDGLHPSVSTDGEWVVFVDAGNLIAIRPDGTDRHSLLANGYHPAW